MKHKVVDKKKALKHYQEQLDAIGAVTNVIQPNHYKKNGMDRIELWKLQYSDQSFRDGMRMLADRYFSRYENKNGVEDLFKGIEVIERLIEWEESLND